MIMMHTWFEVKIRYEKVMENGMNKKSQNLIYLILYLLQKAKEDVLRK